MKSVFSTITDNRVGFIKNDYTNRAKFIDVPNKVTISSVLPFRVKFINTGPTIYGPGNAAPIGIAIIGLNNYVM